MIALFCLIFFAPAYAQENKEKKTRSVVDFSVAVKGDEDTLSNEFTTKSGKWQVGESPKCFQMLPEPLKEGRIEFGPGYRETELTLIAEAWAKSGRRGYPRFGIGVFGKNGFLLRIFPAQKRIELVRRGVVLTKAPFKWKSGEHYLFELSVKEAGEDWKITARVWPKKGKRPRKPQLKIIAWSDELQFPLSGRCAAVATPFSDLPVSFNRVKVLKKEQKPLPVPDEVEKGESE